MNPWLPASECGPACATHAGPTRSTVDQAARWTRLLAATTRAARHVPDGLRDGAREILDALGVELHANTDRLGEPGTLIVANHISWLDVVALLAVEPATFLAKREVAGWPVLGRLATAAGTQFVERGTLRPLPSMVSGLAALLRSGRSVIVFPEGTSWCGPPGGPFRNAVFQAALDAGAPVQPVTVDYRQAGMPSTVAAFVGDDTLAASLRRVVAATGVAVGVTAHPAITARGRDRRELAALARAAVLAGTRV